MKKHNSKKHSFFLILSVTIFSFLIHFSAYAAPSTFCKLLLSASEEELLRNKVVSEIAIRVSPLNQGKPFLVHEEQASVNILDGINRELAKPLLDTSKAYIVERLRKTSTRWFLAAKADIRLRYSKLKQNNDSIVARRKAAKESGVAFDMQEFAQVFIKADQEGLPVVPIVQKYRVIARKVRDAHGDKFSPSKDEDGRLTRYGMNLASEFEQAIAEAVIEGKIKGKELTVKELKAISDEMGGIPVGYRVWYLSSLQEAARESIDDVENALVQYGKTYIVNWDAVVNRTIPIFLNLQKELTENFPLDLFKVENGKEYGELKSFQEEPFTAHLTTARLNSSGVPELELPALKTRVYFDQKLGTMVLENADGPLSIENGVLLVTDHGDGTVKSTASSWKYILPKLFEGGFNATAMNLPKAGIGMNLTGLYPTISYLDYRYRVLAERRSKHDGDATQSGGVVRPLVLLGRSMGSAKGFAHSFLYEGPDNVVDAYVLSSFSNPRTIIEQVKNVYAQVANGTMPGIVEDALDNAKNLNLELWQELEKVRAKNPKAFELVGDKLLYLQGNADEDGGPSVIEDLDSFVRDYSPLGHRYVFYNQLLKYNIQDYEKLDPALFEGTHVLLSNLPNMKKETAPKQLSEVALEDLPAMQDQYFEVIGLIYGFFDYLAESKSMQTETALAQKHFADFREKKLGKDAQGNQRTFISVYAEKAKITPEKLVEVEAGRMSRAARLKRVIEFWKAERLRVDELLRKNSLLGE